MEKHFRYYDLGITDYITINSIKNDCDPESKVELRRESATGITSQGKIRNINESGFTLIGDEKDIESVLKCIKEKVGK